MVARVRLLLVLCLFAIPTFQLAYLRAPDPGLLIGLFAAGSALCLSVVFLALSRVARFERWLPYVTSISDVSLISGALVAFLVVGLPMVAVNSRVIWEVYLLAIAATALRPRRGVAIATTLAALVQYLAIVLYANHHWDLAAQVEGRRIYGSFDWMSEISRLILIGVAGLLATIVIRKIGRISHLAGTDALTDTYNRTYFDVRIGLELRRARHNGSTLTLAMVDIDHFKRINDTLGHEIGDQALIQVAQCLKSGLRRSDILFRHGGDEMAILMPETSTDEARRVLQRVMGTIHDRPIGDQRLTLSVGIAALSADAVDSETLVKAADAHMYAAKANGRNCIMPAAA